MNEAKLTKTQSIISWICQVVAAVILLQTLFFKFSGAPESVYIFETVGMEPFGRYASGVAELIAGVLLLIPALSWAGALLALCVMAGALGAHLTVLGIVVMDDGGTLFAILLTVSLTSAIVAFLRRSEWLRFLKKCV